MTYQRVQLAKQPLPISESVGLIHSMTTASRTHSPLYTQATWDALFTPLNQVL